MKVTSFHFMPYRELPDDADQRYPSMWVDAPWWELGDAEKVGDFYNQSIDELMLAAKLGFDGLGTNEHHQNAYGFMCNPNLFGAILARLTRDLGFDDVAIVQLGATIAATPPIRIAEEYAMLDCISGGRLVAGLPLGLGSDADVSYSDHADRAARALARGDRLPHQGVDGEGVLRLERQALPVPKVNLWPRPIQEPHPPLIVPGAACSTTWDFCHARDMPYAFLSYFGGKSSEIVMGSFWDRAGRTARTRNPYRAAFLQLVAVAETDEQAEEEFGRHVEYFYKKLLHCPPQYLAPPGYSDYKSLLNVFSREFEFAGLQRRSQAAVGEGHDRARVRRRRQPGDGPRAARATWRSG